MKNLFRRALKALLASISRKTIEKHHIEIIFITGWTGTGIVRELTYSLLKNSFNVRRNVTPIWWDLSIPLTILGYEDKIRSFFQWIELLVRATISLIIKPKYPHKVIINLDTNSRDTAKFWTGLTIPHIVVVLREKPQSKIIRTLLKSEGSEKILFVYNPATFDGFKKNQVREFIYGTRSGNLTYKIGKKQLLVQYKEVEAQVKLPQQFIYLREFIPASLSVALLEGLHLKDMVTNLAYFDFHPLQKRNALIHLKKYIYANDD